MTLVTGGDQPPSQAAGPAGDVLPGITAAIQVAGQLTEAALVVRADGTIAFANGAAGPLLGWTDPVVGRSLVALVARRSRRALLGELRRMQRGRSGRPRRVWVERQDRSEVPVHLGFTTCGVGAGRVALVVGWDARGEADPDQYRRIANDLLEVLTDTSRSTPEVTRTLLATIARGLGFDVAILWRRRRGRAELWCEQLWRRPDLAVDAFLEATRLATLRPGDVVPGAVMASGEPLWVPDVGTHPGFRRGGLAASVGLRSGFAFPVRSRGRVIGVVELYGESSRDPDQPLLRAVAHAGSRLGAFLERLEVEDAQAELLGELQVARRRQEFLLEVNRALVGTRTLEETIQRLARLAVPTLGDLCLIDVAGSDGALVRLAAQHADPARQALADQLLRYPPDAAGDHPAAVAVRTGVSHVSPEMSDVFLASSTQSRRHLELTKLLGFTSYATAPVRVHDRALGAITLVSAGSGRRLDRGDLELIEELAGQVAAVVDHARNSAEAHRIAHALQQSLLPARLEAPPGLAVAARYLTGSGGGWRSVATSTTPSCSPATAWRRPSATSRVTT